MYKIAGPPGKELGWLNSTVQSGVPGAAMLLNSFVSLTSRAFKKQLGVSGIYAEISTWRSRKNDGGAQIDLMIDRNDRVINICEMKFSIAAYTITKEYAANLRNKLTVFREGTNTKKTLLLTMITTFGLKQNEHSMQLVNDALDMGALFHKN